MKDKHILFEVCCGSVDDVVEAAAGGADRVELNSSLFFGGLTPSLGSVIEAKARVNIPVIVMIRPRGGGFCYTEAEFAVMEHDAAAAISNGADGIVFGILHSDGTIDRERSAKIISLASGRPAVFHRAIDVTPDPFAALDQLIDLGVTRILTSGQENTVPQGIPLIRKLIEYAKDRIEILPGGGIEPHNLKQVIKETGCSQIHLAAFKGQIDRSCNSRPQVTFGGALYPPEDRYELINREVISSVANKLLD